MNMKILLPVIFGIVASVALFGIVLSMNQKPLSENTLPDNSISDKPVVNPYLNLNSIIQSSLTSKGIAMSNPLKFTGDSISKYCVFFEDAEKQNSLEYCTSTELKDSHDKFLGNIHMVGSIESPTAILGIIQTDPYMSNLDSLTTVYQTMIESTVCKCWQDKKPGNFESVSDWISAAKSHHLEAKRTTSISEIDGLAQKKLFLEITTNTEGYLWKFIITK